VAVRPVADIVVGKYFVVVVRHTVVPYCDTVRTANSPALQQSGCTGIVA
jgi:hypothetical protein